MHMKQYDLNKVSDYINVSFLVVISYYYEMLPLGESGEGVYRISLIISYNRLSVYNYLRIKSFFKKQISKSIKDYRSPHSVVVSCLSPGASK